MLTSKLRRPMSCDNLTGVAQIRFESVDCVSGNSVLWKGVPKMHNSLTEEMLTHISPAIFRRQLSTMTAEIIQSRKSKKFCWLNTREVVQNFENVKQVNC